MYEQSSANFLTKKFEEELLPYVATNKWEAKRCPKNSVRENEHYFLISLELCLILGF